MSEVLASKIKDDIAKGAKRDLIVDLQSYLEALKNDVWAAKSVLEELEEKIEILEARLVEQALKDLKEKAEKERKKKAKARAKKPKKAKKAEYSSEGATSGTEPQPIEF